MSGTVLPVFGENIIFKNMSGLFHRKIKRRGKEGFGIFLKDIF